MNSKVVICGVNTATLPMLSQEEISKLLLKMKDGDGSSRELLIVSNVRLVLSVVKRFNLKNALPDDVFQAGMIGLIKAIDNFDVSFNVRFSTYAVPMIIGEIKRFIKGGNSLRVARSIRDTAYQAIKTRQELEEGGKEATIDEVAEKMQVAASVVAYSLGAISDTISLYDPVYGANNEELLLVDQIGDKKNTEENLTEKLALLSALDLLDEREKKIVYLRYYEGKTQTEISEEGGISQAQVSRIEKNALEFIKQKMSV